VIAFFDLKGKRVFRYTGATSGPEEFMWMGEFVANKEYENTSFSRYKREKRKQTSQ
jgi:thioredoxin-related protein